MDHDTNAQSTFHDLVTSDTLSRRISEAQNPSPLTRVEGSELPTAGNDSSNQAVVQSHDGINSHGVGNEESSPVSRLSESSTDDDLSTPTLQKTNSRFATMKTSATQNSQRPGLRSRNTSQHQSNVYKTLSRKFSSATGKSDAELQDEQAEIERLMSRECPNKHSIPISELTT